MNVTTLICVEFEHAQLKQHVAQVGVVKRRGGADSRNTQFIALLAILKRPDGKIRYLFSHIPDTIMILASHDDAYILFIYPDLAIFVVTDKQTDRTDCFTSCACAQDDNAHRRTRMI